MAGIIYQETPDEFEIDFQGKSKEILYFNAADSRLPERLMELPQVIKSETEKLKEPEIQQSEEGYKEILQYLKEKDKIVCTAIDYAFGNRVSDKIFKYYGAYSVINGRYYILDVLEKIIPEVIKMIEQSQSSAIADLEKYDQYFRKYQDQNE